MVDPEWLIESSLFAIFLVCEAKNRCVLPPPRAVVHHDIKKDSFLPRFFKATLEQTFLFVFKIEPIGF